MRVPASQVLCTIGTPCTLSAVGSTETHRALVTRSPLAIGFAAYDAGLVAFDLARSTAAEPCFVHASGELAGEPVSIQTIEATWGARLRSSMGIRRLSRERLAPHLLTDIAAPLPHDLEEGGLRRLAGLTFSEVRHSPLMDLFGLFDDDPRLQPSLQSQLFLYGGLGALAALPAPLATLLPDPERFRVVAACAFPGMDSHAQMTLGMQPKHETVPDKKNDKLAYRLASSLSTHGPSLLSTVLAPAFNLSRVRRNPDLLGRLRGAHSAMRRVPQAPLVSSAACASALVSFCDAAASALLQYPGHASAQMFLWTAADAALLPDARILEGFGIAAMMSQEKLDQMNAGRPLDEQRSVAECLAPFDLDAQGTVVGHAGSGVIVTTLEFALRNFRHHFIDCRFRTERRDGRKGAFRRRGLRRRKLEHRGVSHGARSPRLRGAGLRASRRPRHGNSHELAYGSGGHACGTAGGSGVRGLRGALAANDGRGAQGRGGRALHG